MVGVVEQLTAQGPVGRAAAAGQELEVDFFSIAAKRSSLIWLFPTIWRQEALAEQGLIWEEMAADLATTFMRDPGV